MRNQCVPMYQAEVSTPESRGFMVCYMVFSTKKYADPTQVSMHGVMFALGYVSWPPRSL